MNPVATAVVLVSGWAMSAEVMEPLATALSEAGYTVTALSLADAQSTTWEALFQRLEQSMCGRPAVLVGWSLGGNLCARFAALKPEQVLGLVTLGSTPTFVAAPDWPHGKHPELFAQFADRVATDINGVMREFVQVCARGGNDWKGSVRALSRATSQALQQDTDWRDLLNRLAEDARQQWQRVGCPAYHLLAEQDPLAKAAMANDLQQLLPNHTVQVLAGGHALFLEHRETILACVQHIVAGLRGDDQEGKQP